MIATSNFVAILQNHHDDRHKLGRLFMAVFNVFCGNLKPPQNYLYILKKSCGSLKLAQIVTNIIVIL